MLLSAKTTLTPFAVIYGIVCCAAVVDAQERSDLKVGDRVEVRRFDEWKPGEIVEIDARGKRVKVLLD